MSMGKIIFRTPSKIKIRKMWQRNPVTKIKQSSKIYNRQETKKFIRERELNEKKNS